VKARVLMGLFALSCSASCALSCGGEPSPSGLSEPVRVRNAVFKSGELPGSPPGATLAPTVTAIESPASIIAPGQVGKNLTGRATPEAASVAVRFTDLGSGYWVLPVDGIDPLQNGEATWQLSADFAREIAPGPHPLRFVAIDQAGHAGTQREFVVCATSPIPDNLNACDRTLAPPAVVVSLAWDTNADVDLVVVTPGGKIIDAKHPSTAAAVDGKVPAEELAKGGVIERDSNGGCAIDGQRRESLVFQGEPALGRYLIYANLFDACTQPSAHFTLTVNKREKAADGTFRLVETQRRAGVLTSIDANGGAKLGLFVLEASLSDGKDKAP
jgi:hypothetical protein